MSFFSESDLQARQLLEGITLKVVSGDKTMMTIFEFELNAVIPSHKHPHEQITYVLEGELEFTVEGETRLLRKGDGVVIPPIMSTAQRFFKRLPRRLTRGTLAEKIICEEYGLRMA